MAAVPKIAVVGLLWCFTFSIISFASLIHAIDIWDTLGSLFSLAMFSMSGIYTARKVLTRYVNRKSN